MKQDKYYIDIDGAIKHYNLENPETPISRGTLVKELGITYQSLFNYQFGKIPNIIGTLVNIAVRTGVPVEELIRTQKQEKHGK